MILALRVFGRSRTQCTRCGRSAAPSWAAIVCRTSSASASVDLDPRSRHREDDDRLALDLVRHADRGGLLHGGVRGRRRLHLGRADPLARHLEGVVRAPADEPVAVVVDLRPVAVHPDTGEAAPVGLEVALRVAPEAARHARPRAGARPARRPRRAPDGRRRRSHRRPSPAPGALKPQGTIGRSVTQPTMPPLVSVPPE